MRGEETCRSITIDAKASSGGFRVTKGFRGARLSGTGEGVDDRSQTHSAEFVNATSGYGRLGVRHTEPTEMRRLASVAAALYFVSGASVVQIWATARDDVAHPPQYLVSGLVICALATLFFALGHSVSDSTIDALFPGFALAVMFGASLLIPVVLYFAGFAAFAIGSTVYVLPLIFGFWLLTRPLAIVMLVVIGAGHALLLAITETVVAPASQWAFLMAVLAAAGVLVGGLANRYDRAARSEMEARLALAQVNSALERRVDEQVDELERLSRLRRFLSPQVADAVVTSGSESFLVAHRREIAVFFCDLRGFTAFSTQVEPEEVVGVLNDYYEVVGEQVRKFEATVGAFAGDGIMAYLNDPNPCEEPGWRAVQMALALRNPMEELHRAWTQQGYTLGYGIGIALGHATLGVIGFEGRNDYTPLGTVVNLASRLCDEATASQILIDRRTQLAVKDRVATRQIDAPTLKGFASPSPVYEVVSSPT